MNTVLIIIIIIATIFSVSLSDAFPFRQDERCLSSEFPCGLRHVSPEELHDGAAGGRTTTGGAGTTRARRYVPQGLAAAGRASPAFPV